MSNKDYAVELFEMGYNCAQAIVIAYGKDYGLDKETSIKIASSFGSGIAGTGETCGTMIGATIILGLKYGNESNSHVRNLIKKFKTNHKGTTCRALLTEDFPTVYKTHSRRCARLVEEVCDLLEQELK